MARIYVYTTVWLLTVNVERFRRWAKLSLFCVATGVATSLTQLTP